ncbi:hypothetical protein ACFVXD_43650, partial [Kitasatospora herbaricolor]
MTPDSEWLKSSSREYPVFVDPTTASSLNDSERSFKSNGLTNTNLGVFLGNSNNGGIWRTQVHYNYEQFFGKQILDAQIVTSGPVSSDSSQGTFSGGVYYAPCFGYTCVGDYLSPLAIGASGGHSNQNGAIADRVASWVRAGSSGGNFTLTGDETANKFTYKKVQTALYLLWKDYPSAGVLTSPSPSNGGTASMAPTLKVAGSKDPGGQGLAYMFRVSLNANPDSSPVADSKWISTPQYKVSQTALISGKKYYWKMWVRDGYDNVHGSSTQRASAVWSFTTGPSPKPNQGTSEPTNKGMVTTLSPTFDIDDVTGTSGSVKYWFRITTGTDGVTGQIANSGWISTPTWTPPTGTLQDGNSYSWGVLIRDGSTDFQPWWTSQFTVNLRIGDSGPSPTEKVGPVTVNMANGNGSLSFSSPTVNTVGGPMGLSFNYNTLKPSNQGLRGEYFDKTPAAGETAKDTFDGEPSM